MDLKAIQSALAERGFDAWLFYDHHHRDPIAYRVLGVSESLMVTRRWYYVIPAQGDPRKLVHRIEAGHLDALPGAKTEYSSWQEQQEGIRQMLAPYKTIAMEYSHNNAIPYIGLVDAGTIELLRSFGKEIASSGDLVARFEAAWTDDQIKTHFAARDAVDKITEECFKEIGRRVRGSSSNGGGTHEYEMQQWILEAFKRESLVTEDFPIVAVNANSGNPHFEPTAAKSAPIKEGDFVLLDIWAKKNTPGAVYYDITWVGVLGNPSDKQREVFSVVSAARNAGVAAVKEAISAGRKLQGFQVDDAARAAITAKGYGKYFTHRTGHSIGPSVHGNGANMDNLETHDVREIIPNSCFSIEPGIYLPEFGVRSEVNVLVRKGSAEVTGREQKELVLI